MQTFRTPLRILIFSLITFTICRLFLYYSYPDYFSTLTVEQLLRALLKGAQFDSATLVSSCVLFFILLTLPFNTLQTYRVRRFSLYFIFAIFFLLLSYTLADISYFGEVKRHIGAEILNISADIEEMTSLAINSRLSDIIQSIIFLVFVTITWYFFILKPEKKQRIQLPTSFVKRLLYWLATVGFIIFCIRGFIPTGRPINIADAFIKNGSIAQANLSLNPAYLSFREIQKRQSQQALALSSESSVKAFVQQNPAIFNWQRPNAIPTGKNVVLILLESWNSRHIDSLSGSSYKVTPFFDSLVPKSHVWRQNYAAGQRSIVGIQAVLSSVPALPSFGTIGFGLEIKNFSRIGEILQQNGYNSLMMQTSKRRSFQMENIATALGFEEYYGQEDIPLLLDYPQSQPPFGWDYDGLQFLAQKLSEKPDNKPFFAFIFTGTTHEPFPRLPDEFELYPHDLRAESGYLNALRYSDWSLEQFFSRIENEPWFNNTIFILTADHTLNLQKSEKDVKARPLSREDFHIPLLIYTPDGSLPPKQFNHITSQYDVLPTITDLLGFKQKISTFGQSLYDTPQNEEAYVFASDNFGLITPTQTIFFSEENSQAQDKGLSPQDSQALNHLKLKLQYADELLRQNRWTD